MISDLFPSALVRDAARLGSLAGLNLLDTPPETEFEDIVIGLDRVRDAGGAGQPRGGRSPVVQARVGFPPCETALNASVCAYTLAEPTCSPSPT